MLNCPLPPIAEERFDPMFMRRAELSLSLTGCHTWESWPHTLLGQQLELALVAGGPGEPAEGMRTEELTPPLTI